MKISITGQGTLAAAAGECCRRHFDVMAVPSSSCRVLWICHDTPIRPDGAADIPWVRMRVAEDVAAIDPTALVLISSQIPVGTTHDLEADHPGFTFAYCPENIRAANAVADFESQARILVGVRTPRDNRLLEKLLSPFTSNIIFTDPETAEIAKSALNTFLALQIAYINEVSLLCREAGANPHTVSMALRTDSRVSPKAPLRPGPPFGLGHLEREIRALSSLGSSHGVTTRLISSILPSNEAHAAAAVPCPSASTS